MDIPFKFVRVVLSVLQKGVRFSKHAIIANMNEEWHSDESLDQYFPEDHVSADEKAIQRFLISFLRKQTPQLDRMLDFGAGPTIHRIVPFAPHANHIEIAEFLPESRQAIRRWIRGEKGSRNWDTYVRTTLKLEGVASDTRAVAKRRALLKSKIGRIVPGDIRKPHPLGKAIHYPLVTSFYCADAVTTSKKLWQTYMRNLSNLVAPQGWLIITVSADTNYSLLDGEKMPNVKLHEDDIRRIYAVLGYDMRTFRIKRISAKMWTHVGIANVLVASAQKNVQWLS